MSKRPKGLKGQKEEASAGAGTEAGVAVLPSNLKKEFREVALAAIQPGSNDRVFDAETMAYINGELVPSIRQHGILSPPWIRPLEKQINGVEYELIAGECRWRGGTIAGVMATMCLVIECDDRTARELGVIENLKRKNLNPADEALGLKRMVEEFGYSAYDESNPDKSLGHRLNIGKSAIYTKLKLASLPKLGLDALRSREISPSVAGRISRIANKDGQKEALARAIDEHWSDEDAARQIEEHYMTELKGAPFDRKDAELVPDRGACETCSFRSGNQLEIFGELATGRGDICTDPPCFRKKCERAFKVRAKEHVAKGGVVLSEAEAKRAGLTESRSYVSGEYSELDAGVWVSKWGMYSSSTKWRELLGQLHPEHPGPKYVAELLNVDLAAVYKEAVADEERREKNKATKEAVKAAKKKRGGK